MRIVKTHIPVLTLALFFALSSCEEVIDIDLNSADPVLVAEGYMELDSLCSLSLTFTTDYFQQEAPLLVEDAVVTLSDQSGASEILSYMGMGMYSGRTIRGLEFSKYTLTIETGEQIYTGFSSLNPLPVFDSVILEDFPFGGPNPDEDFPKMLTISFRNDPEREDHFMLRLIMNGEIFEDYFALASDEYSTSAETVEYTTMMFPTEDGDTLAMEVYAIDKDTYRYYSQINEAIGGSMAMSSTPYNPASNLGEDILGYFMARSRFDTTLVLQ
ncbi:MAG: DUF4249 family protein [Bacteroidetes bacterium]|nr:DUF4249 family protein [Bacteroidota bacterium]